MERKLISVGIDLPGYSDLYHEYSTTQSLLDADIIVFQSDRSSYGLDYADNGYYQGKPCLNNQSSFRLREDTQHWKKELATALQAGKTVFVVFCKFEEFFIHTGNRNVTGTGRNARVTNIVASYNNYQFLPFPFSSIIPKEGREIVSKGHPVFSAFWHEFKDYLKYESYIDGKVENPLFLTRTGEKVVGALFKVGIGNLVLLPPLDYEGRKFI